MAFMGLLSTGLGLLGGVESLLGGNAAAERARIAEENAIRDFEASAGQEQLDALQSGTQGLLKLSGGLSNALQSTGRGLGAATAAAGVYNSSATAGALANQAAANAATLGSYSTNVADTLERMKQQTAQEAAGMKFGMAQNNLNFARQQQASSQQGLASFLGNLGQVNFGSTGAQGATMGQGNSVLTPGNDYPVGNPYGGTGFQLPNNYYENKF